jgi:hypothetical protein
MKTADDHIWQTGTVSWNDRAAGGHFAAISRTAAEHFAADSWTLGAAGERNVATGGSWCSGGDTIARGRAKAHSQISRYVLFIGAFNTAWRSALL